ncbi:hypothetical protein [Streptomyces sp. NRRL F-5123]|uniref:hypothetical protein n=1 Tax=Streptomyces sp. NRRL F-5123 TaxID=1463856 RepID=UPI000AC9FF25|nr:hypothetical protein [Streptomyces sp. NRRL F-5123]
MSNDVSIDVQIRDQSAAGFTAVNAQLRTLKGVAESTANGLRTLTTRAGTAALSLRAVGRDADSTTRSLTDLRAAAGDVRVRARVDNDTHTGADQVRHAVRDLERLGPVEIRVHLASSAGDITATARALRDLKSQARDAGQSTATLATRSTVAATALEALRVAAEGAADKLERLRDKATETAVALALLRTRASSAATAVGSLRDRADAAGTRVHTLSTHTQTLTTDLTHLHGAATTAGTSLSSLSGSVGSVTTSSSRASGATDHLVGALVSLAPALLPVAAQLGPIAAGAGAAGAAMIAFGAAVAPQISQISDLSKSLDVLQQQQIAGGVRTEKAVQAEQKALTALKGAPAVTLKAAAAYGTLKDAFTAWSNSLADFTMQPVIKSFAVVEGILPKLSPLAQDASAQLDRLMTLAGGAVSTPGFDSLMAKLDTYTNKVLKRAGDETVHFSRLLSEGRADGPIQQFMAYARSEGPHVRQVLQDLATTVSHVIQGMAQAGPSMLTVVDALARIVNAVPPEALGRLLQLYTAFKLVKLAGAGLTSVAGGVQSLATRLVALRAASTAAGGGLAGVRAALATLSTGTKVTGAVAVVAGVVLAMKALQGSGKAAPDVQKLTSAMGQFGRTGKITGEAAVAFGGNFDRLNSAIDRLSGGGSKMDKFNDTMNKVFTLGMGKSNSLKEAEKDLDAVDKSLAQLVQNGQADLAAAAIAKMGDELAKNGKPTKDLTAQLDDYKSAVADAKFEQDLAADSMGLFGQQAQDVQQKLDAQKQSADGLRQSIQALNDANREGLNAESDFEQAIDDATAAIKGHHTALKMVNGQLDLNSQKSRDAYKPLADLAEKTDAAAAAARDNGKSWAEVQRIYDRGRDTLIRTATQMGLTKTQAKALADQILATPDKTALLKGDLTDLQTKLAKAKADLKAAPPGKEYALRGNVIDLQNKVAAAQRAIDKVHGKTVTITYRGLVSGAGVPVAGGGRYAHGGVVGAASGGPRSRMTLVGEQGPELVDLAAGSRVHTANETRHMLSGAGGGSAQPILVQFALDGRVLAEQLLVPQRDLIQRVAGGDVQKALGGRTR